MPKVPFLTKIARILQKKQRDTNMQMLIINSLEQANEHNTNAECHIHFGIVTTKKLDLLFKKLASMNT